VPLRLVLADDHVLVRQGLRALLEEGGFVVVGEAADGREAVRMVRNANPDVAVLDIAMPNFNGLSAALELSRTAPTVRVLVLSEHAEQQYVGEALRCGVRGYVLKSQAAHELVTAIRRVCRVEVYLSPGISGAVAAACASPDLIEAELTLRERQGAAADRRGVLEPGGRRESGHQSQDGGVAPLKSHAQARDPRHGGAGALRDPARADQGLTSACRGPRQPQR
jgi:DNA-binding NarL/FixJ family response regulator